jgi:hypothetical protein
MEEAGAVTLQRFWFPGWRAWVDGRPTPTRPPGPDGLVAVNVPAGEHEVRFAFESTPLRRGAWWLSAAGLFGWAALAVAHRRWSGRRSCATAPFAHNDRAVSEA